MSRRNSPQFHTNRKILLQGNPPCHWCGKPNATGTNKPISDTNRYKMCGNGVASPVAAWIGKHLLAPTLNG